MLWFKRILWLTAWNFWLWLGIGLYRELPRNLGPVVCKLPLGELEEALGFLGDERVVVTTRRNEDGKSLSCRLWDVEARNPKSETPINFIGDGEIEISTQPSLGFVVGEPKPSEDGKGSSAPLQSIDLRTGERRVLCSSPRHVYTGAFNDRRPWMFATHEVNDVQRCEIYDLRTGEIIFEWRPPPPKAGHRTDIVNAHWLPGTDLLYFEYWITPEGFKLTTSHVIEVWDVANKTQRSRRLLSDVFAHSSNLAANGRIILGHPTGRPSEFDVLDGLSGSVVLSNRRASESFINDDALKVGITRGLSLSEGGRCLYLPDAVWNIDRRRLVWSAVKGLEDLIHSKASKGFFVAERWSLWLFENGWPLPPWRIPDVWAVRDLETGAVLYRVYDRHPLQDSLSSDGSLAVHYDGTVYRIPPRANWPLLALCQTILALPLILLWVILRWRHRRATLRSQRQVVPGEP